MGLFGRPSTLDFSSRSWVWSRVVELPEPSSISLVNFVRDFHPSILSGAEVPNRPYLSAIAASTWSIGGPYARILCMGTALSVPSYLFCHPPVPTDSRIGPDKSKSSKLQFLHHFVFL